MIGNLAIKFETPLTQPGYMRLMAWKQALGDASCYFAIARCHADLMEPGQFVPCVEGGMSLDYMIQKGMISAAIMAASQIVISGDKGEHVSGNKVLEIDKLRAWLFEQVDGQNQWTPGHTQTVFDYIRKDHRNKLVAHYDGSVANVQYSELGGQMLSWRGPNPLYRGDAFVDLERAVDTLYPLVKSVLSDHRCRMESPDGENGCSLPPC